MQMRDGVLVARGTYNGMEIDARVPGLRTSQKLR